MGWHREKWYHWWKLENAYRIEIGQKDNSGRNCNKCEVSFKKQEKFRKHLIRGHKKQIRVDVVMIFHLRAKLSRSWINAKCVDDRFLL